MSGNRDAAGRFTSNPPVQEEDGGQEGAGSNQEGVDVNNLNFLANMSPQQIQGLLLQMVAQSAETNRQLVELQRDRIRAESVPLSNGSERAPHVNPPEPFSGSKPDKLESFLTRCRQVFTLQPNTYQTERQRVGYMASFLTGPAAQAVDPLLQIQQQDDYTPQEISSVAAFSEYLEASFGDPDPKGSARRGLATLTMTGTAVEYFSSLRRYFAVLRWTEQAPIVDRAMAGLSEELKDEVARHGNDFESLNELSAFCIPLDNRLRARRAEKAVKNRDGDKSFSFQSRSNVPVAPVVSHPSNPSVPGRPLPAVPQKAVQTSGGMLGSPSPRMWTEGVKLSREELDRREAEGKCRYCGGVGHKVHECSKRQFAEQRKNNFWGGGGSNVPPKA